MRVAKVLRPRVPSLDGYETGRAKERLRARASSWEEDSSRPWEELGPEKRVIFLSAMAEVLGGEEAKEGRWSLFWLYSGSRKNSVLLALHREGIRLNFFNHVREN